MAASERERVPDSLYNTSISAIIGTYNDHKKDIDILPRDVQCDIYYRLYLKGDFVLLGQAFCDLDTMDRVLKVRDKRQLVHRCFQTVMDNYQENPARALADSYCERCCAKRADTHAIQEKCIKLGISLGRFLSDSGWNSDAGRIYSAALRLTNKTDLPQKWKLVLEIRLGLLHVKTEDCKYTKADEIWNDASLYIAKAEKRGTPICKTVFFMEYCALLLSKGSYGKAYRYCCRALREIQHNALSPSATVDVFRLCAKVCVAKHLFKKAEILIKYAVRVARKEFGNKHYKYADALLDYGLCLLRLDYVDAIDKAVLVYQAALDIRVRVFGGNNLQVAQAHEGLAYSLYAKGVKTGNFQDARRHAELSLDVLVKIVPEDHVRSASPKRVKALILEEIAYDTDGECKREKLLQEAERLHLHSLELFKHTFGENHVQTAIQYQNLGHLYVAMQNCEKAEMMHLTAIKLLERLLGLEHYIVAGAVGYLARIYSYHMHKYTQAEELYQRSISILLKQFGPGYGLLEHCYKALIQLYSSTQNVAKMLEYQDMLQDWYRIRDRWLEQNVGPPRDIKNQVEMSDVIARFFEKELS